MHLRPISLIVLTCALSGAACSSGAAPDSRTADPRVRLRVEALPAAPRAGDTVRLFGIFANATAERIDLNSACGPPVLFEVTTPAGARVYPVPLDAPFDCPLIDFHVLTPGETDTVAVDWRAPAIPGRYAVRAGFRQGSRLTGLTAPREVEVRR